MKYHKGDKLKDKFKGAAYYYDHVIESVDESAQVYFVRSLDTNKQRPLTENQLEICYIISPHSSL